MKVNARMKFLGTEKGVSNLPASHILQLDCYRVWNLQGFMSMNLIIILLADSSHSVMLIVN